MNALVRNAIILVVIAGLGFAGGYLAGAWGRGDIERELEQATEQAQLLGIQLTQARDAEREAIQRAVENADRTEGILASAISVAGSLGESGQILVRCLEDIRAIRTILGGSTASP